MAAPDPLKNGRRPKARIAFEQGHNLPVPTVAERILTRRPRGDFFAKGAADAAQCDRQRLRSTRPWPQQQLPSRSDGNSCTNLIRQSVMWRPGGVVPHPREDTVSYPIGRDRQPTRPFAGPAPFAGFATSVGYALLPSRTRRHFLTVIAAPQRRAARRKLERILQFWLQLQGLRRSADAS
jgi:hypothetical protein